MKTLRDATALAAASALALFAPARAAPADIYFERSLMAVAGARCALFAPGVAAALDASRRQAWGSALRGGASEAELAGVRRRAEAKAYSLPCDAPELARAAVRVRDAYNGYARLWKMTFPGEAAAWVADRAAPSGHAPAARWAVAQTATDGVTLGLAAERGGRALTALFPGASAAKASSARLVMRDPRLAASPYIDPRVSGLKGRTPPRSASRAWLASGRGPAPAGLASGPAQVFRFPDAAAQALAALDPRETVVLELVVPAARGEEVSRSLFEVGDFAAATAFLAVR